MKLYCNEKFVGFLEPRFDEWRLEIEHTPALPLSPYLMAKKGERIVSEAVKHFFINYLPEEPYADRVAARIKPYPRTYHDWLTALGQELTGAFALTPDGQFLSDAIYEDLPLERLAEGLHASRTRADAIAFTLTAQKQGEELAQTLPRLSLAGAQDKFALWFDAKQRDADQHYKIATGRAATTHIFKPDSTDARFAYLPANEFACAQLARAVGLSVAHTQITTLGGVRTLVVERFDRKRRGLQVQRLHQIDLCQLMNLPREKKYGSHGAGIDTEDFFKACDQLAVPALARRSHLQAWLFNFIIGNQDAHAKNYSFIYQNGWQAAPLYDLICVTPYLPEQTLSMGLLGEYRAGWLVAEHWRELAQLSGVTLSYLMSEMQGLIERVKMAAQSLEKPLRQALTDDERDFLASKINPVIHTRLEYLSEGLSSLH
jgi:serine/threonine-protein kinase HipA